LRPAGDKALHYLLPVLCAVRRAAQIETDIWIVRIEGASVANGGFDLVRLEGEL
jgi:hypothetical protein